MQSKKLRQKGRVATIAHGYHGSVTRMRPVFREPKGKVSRSHLSLVAKQLAVVYKRHLSKSYIFDVSMVTFNTIIEQLKNVPADRLEDVYAIVHSLGANTKNTGETSNEILSFAGSFADMAEKDYNDFLQQTQQTRNDLFDRDINV